jgi:hypothetical protein
MTRAVQIAELGDQNVFTIDGDNNRVGIGSTQPTVKLDVDGVVVATAFTGDGSGLTGIAATDNIVTGTAATFTGGINVSGASNIDVTGVVTATTFSGNITGVAATFTGDVTATTFSGNITGVAATFTGDVTIGGELTYEDVTNVDSVGFATFRKGINVQGAGSTTTTLNVTGVSTFGGNVSIADSIIHTGDTDTSIRFPAADTFTVETGGSERVRVTSAGRVGIGSDAPVKQLQVGSHGVSSEGTIALASNTSGTCSILMGDGSTGTDFYRGYVQYSNASDAMLFATSVTERLRITSTGGFHFTNGELIERAKVTAGKLSDNTNIDLENGMVHLFTTQETTTSTPNIRINSSTSLNSVMAIGEMISVTLITTAAAGAYSAQLTIDGGAVTENWTGGSAPSDGGSSGVDIHAYTIIKTADATFTVIATQTKTS